MAFISDTDLISNKLLALLDKWRSARKPQEKKMVNLYADYMRIARAGDTAGSGLAKAGKSTNVFVGSTRNKVRSARAKIKDTLFGGKNDLPFDLKAKSEEFEPFTETMEIILRQQLKDGDVIKGIKRGLTTLSVYGSGDLLGPFVRENMKKEVMLETDELGNQVIIENEKRYNEPYYKLARPLDIYPDPDADCPMTGSGFFWVTRMLPSAIREEFKGKKYKNVSESLKGLSSERKIEGADLLSEQRGNIVPEQSDGRVEVIRFFGEVSERLLSNVQDDGSDTNFTTINVESVAVIVGTTTIYAEKSVFDKRPIRRAIWEDGDDEMYGVGVAENNEPHQKIINAAFRLYLDGKAFALLPALKIDRSAFMPSEDFLWYPNKVFQHKPGLSPEQKDASFKMHVLPDVSNGWERVIQMSEEFSDNDTSVTKYTQGNESKSLNKTATGISMIMNAASLPLKEVMTHIDDMWIEPCLADLVEWDLEYLEVETVKLLHGEEHAQRWAIIKQFGQSEFMTWKATGSSTMMLKEVLTNKLQGFMAIVGGNPLMSQIVDLRDLLEEVWESLELGMKSPVKTEEELRADQQAALEQQMMAQNNPQGNTR